MRKLLLVSISILFIFLSSCSDDSEPQVPDTIAPTMEISIAGIYDKANGEAIVVSNQMEIIIDAKDEGGISKVEAFINDGKVGEDTAAPYSIIVNVSSYASKVGKSLIYEDYTLKITATDLNGNKTSTELKINIDNEIPSITKVSIAEGAILNGDVNTVSFEVGDNEELSSVKVFINDELLSEITDENYAVNIDVNILEHGENILKIEAKDPAENVGTHIVNFIAENKGPEIYLLSIKDGQIVDETINLTPHVVDEFSEVSSLEIFYNEESLVLFDSLTTNYQFDFDPDLFEAGDGILTLLATDSFENSSQVSFNINILRLLLKINIPEGYFSPSISSSHFVFASEMDGSVIAFKELTFETREVKLHALEEFESDKEFTLTFASMGNPGSNTTLYSIFNLNREEPKQLDLQVPMRFSSVGSNYYPINGFDVNTSLNCFGRDYYFSSNEAGDEIITDFVPSNHTEQSKGLYIFGYNPLNDFHNYLFVERPIPADFEINFDDFSTQNLETRQLNTSPNAFLADNFKGVAVFGYQNQEDLDNDIYHKIGGEAYGKGFPNFNYQVNTQFYEYAHTVTIGNYFSSGIGLPPEIIEIPDWTIDYTFQNNRINLIKSGSGYTNGEILLLGGFDANSPYEWNVVFDATDTDEIVLPNIPVELQNYSFNNQYQNAQLEINRVGLLNYKNIVDYSDYLENIVKKNKTFGKSAPVFETIISLDDGYQNFSNNGYFYNWW